MRPDEFQAFLKAVLPSMGYRWRRFDRRNVRRRVRRRMESLRIFEPEKYARLLASDPVERARLDELLRLTISRFFRNSALWGELESLVPQLTGELGAKDTLKVWCAGCAGGEEPFSMAMLMQDLTESGTLKHGWSVLGTDTDRPSLDRARQGVYSRGSVREIPSPYLERWFTRDGDEWILEGSIRNLVEFREHNLVTAKPPGLFHLVFVRNSLLTYNTTVVQREVLSRICTCMLEPGYLIIGRTENLPDGTGFEEVKRCIYRVK